ATMAAQAITDKAMLILYSSGCGEPRVARPRPRPAPERTRVARNDAPQTQQNLRPPGDQERAGQAPAPASPSAAASDEDLRTADVENEEGKKLFRSGDFEAARRRFSHAVKLNRDPRYVFNLCLVQEALEDFEAAEKACREVISLQPSDGLREKA